MRGSCIFLGPRIELGFTAFDFFDIGFMLNRVQSGMVIVLILHQLARFVCNS